MLTTEVIIVWVLRNLDFDTSDYSVKSLKALGMDELLK